MHNKTLQEDQRVTLATVITVHFHGKKINMCHV
jgi:hypothetical protein